MATDDSLSVCTFSAQLRGQFGESHKGDRNRRGFDCQSCTGRTPLVFVSRGSCPLRFSRIAAAGLRSSIAVQGGHRGCLTAKWLRCGAVPATGRID